MDGADAIDVARASRGSFSADPQSIFETWAEFGIWAKTGLTDAPREPVNFGELQCPIPAPRQLFAVGLNYGAHNTEVKRSSSAAPVVFTKFVSSISGPYDPVHHPGGDLDWEAELVVVIGRGGHHISVDAAWGHVAGLTVGQDFSERVSQRTGSPPQWSLAKSYAGFAPLGPVIVTPDEFARPDDLAIQARVNGEIVQSARTSELIFGVPELISYLSEIVTLLPGDVIFTGTPAGTGIGMNPQRFLMAGDVVETTIEGIGSLRNVVTADSELV
ncbi:fumarylacetoacetate hydrolase family protein [Microbacterium pseudoresistens]|uniref:2-keto-4-pentenoate hydratase/2-oxohepta-3-ene-1,7-dioic acid hydratase in catechol pathway n=1 Tax=Microbacterium pseudoresistens TaxID=640634 RepID=A0A7Y9EVP4_9MICO|nr:fumarylacetoacetate hydrolase family protein [Microbacterium pseudoresistens]NYD53945.1 2-keto-4-pentenoate hydratase/2-oxohepta-3-ene-1,7-dioic acid hydratase in catechol pathway [Microbacterium pseudoresistens]